MSLGHNFQWMITADEDWRMSFAPRRLCSGLHQQQQQQCGSVCVFTHPGHGQVHFTNGFNSSALTALCDKGVSTEVAFVPDGGFSLRILNLKEVQGVTTNANQLVIDSRWIASSSAEICGYRCDSLYTMQCQRRQLALMQSCEACSLQVCTVREDHIHSFISSGFREPHSTHHHTPNTPHHMTVTHHTTSHDKLSHHITPHTTQDTTYQNHKLHHTTCHMPCRMLHMHRTTPHHIHHTTPHCTILHHTAHHVCHMHSTQHTTPNTHTTSHHMSHITPHVTHHTTCHTSHHMTHHRTTPPYTTPHHVTRITSHHTTHHTKHHMPHTNSRHHTTLQHTARHTTYTTPHTTMHTKTTHHTTPHHTP